MQNLFLVGAMGEVKRKCAEISVGVESPLQPGRTLGSLKKGPLRRDVMDEQEPQADQGENADRMQARAEALLESAGSSLP
jgi:hypothetical protein